MLELKVWKKGEQMKILVDSSLTQNEDWFESFPVIINNEEDVNDPISIPRIIENKENRTAFFSFEKLRKHYKINNSDKVVIFTIPRSMSGQYDNYTIQNESDNILIVEGTSLFTKREEVKEILSTSSSLKEVGTRIDVLNKTVEMTGVILSAKSLNLKGRLHSLVALLIKSANVKIKMVWKDGKWSKDKVSLNGMALVKKSIRNERIMNFICSGIKGSKSEKIVQKFKKDYPYSTIHVQPMTNSMIAHSGKDFIVIY